MRARTVIRVPDSEKWNAEEVMKIAATPRQPNLHNRKQREANNMRDTKGLDLGGDGSTLEETLVQASKESKVRVFRITLEIIKRFGYTRGCLGCEAKLFGIEHRNHTPACRARLRLEKLKETRYKRYKKLKSCKMSVTQQQQKDL